MGVISRRRGLISPKLLCEVAGVYRRERRDYRCWLRGRLIFYLGDLSCCIKPEMVRGNGGKADR